MRCVRRMDITRLTVHSRMTCEQFGLLVLSEYEVLRSGREYRGERIDLSLGCLGGHD